MDGRHHQDPNGPQPAKHRPWSGAGKDVFWGGGGSKSAAEPVGEAQKTVEETLHCCHRGEMFWQILHDFREVVICSMNCNLLLSLILIRFKLAHGMDMFDNNQSILSFTGYILLIQIFLSWVFRHVNFIYKDLQVVLWFDEVYLSESGD